MSRKLEAQTQRLELLTAQSMANGNLPARQPDSHTMPENAPYADEGDEVIYFFIFQDIRCWLGVCVGVGVDRGCVCALIVVFF